jgi:predicted cupin superfamily sugar epimerase
MDNRASHLISTLDLRPHPEGGYYREVFRSRLQVQPQDSRPARAALTTIYFLLVEGDVSRWHRVASDEVWHFYEGDPLELLTIDAKTQQVERYLLGGVRSDARPIHVVPAGVWQAARTTDAYTLVGCTVGPGFDFADFQMLRDTPGDAARLTPHLGAAASFL